MMEGATSKNRAPVKSTSIRGNIDHVYGNSSDFFSTYFGHSLYRISIV